MRVGGFNFSLPFEFAIEFVDAQVDGVGSLADFEIGYFGADVLFRLDRVFYFVGAPFSAARCEAKSSCKRVRHREQPQEKSARRCNMVTSAAIELDEEWA